MSPLLVVVFAALAVVVVGWLAVSFSAPGPRRERIEWLSTTALFATLVAFFLRLALAAREEGSTAALVGFAALCVFFSGGFIVSGANTIRSLRGGSREESSATH